MTDEDNKKLCELNLIVEKSIKEREVWLNTKMSEYAKVSVGEDIYNLCTGERLGKVTRLYRYWSDKNPYLDTIMNINYEYEISPCLFDNTSRQIGLVFGRKEEVWK